MRALIVEDDATIADFVARGLREAGFAVDHRRATARPGSTPRSQQPYDVAIVDLMLPEARRPVASSTSCGGAASPTPVLILSARRSVDDRVQRPAGGRRRLPHQAVRVCRAAGARAGARAPRDARAGADDADGRRPRRSICCRARSRAAARRIDLRPREFALLEYLMRNAGQVVSKTMILSHVWEYNFDPQTNIVDVLVSRLREKIDRPFEKKLLHTVRGVGYVLR